MIFRKSFIFALSASLALAAFAAHAKENAPKLEEMTVVASRTEMPLRQVGASVSILTEEDLKQMAYPSLAQTLRTLPSVRVVESGGLGKATDVRIRGEDSHRTLLLIDGIDVSDPSSPQIAPQFGHMLNSQWGRVEVLRGPQGMMYGADAGGVVRLSSKMSDEPTADIAAEYGRYDTRRLSGNARGTIDKFSYSVTASDLSTDGFNARESDTSLMDDDGYENTTLHAKTNWALTDTMGVGLVGRSVEGRSEFDSCAWPDGHDCVAEFRQEAARLDWHYDTDKQSHEIAYGVNRTDRANTIVDENREDFNVDSKLTQWQYLGRYQFADDFSMVFGLDHRHDEFMDHFRGQAYERNQKGVYAEGQVSYGDQFFYTIGVRYDDNDDFGTHDSYRATAAYLIPAPVGEFKLKGGYSTGFRAPSLYEVNHNTNVTTVDYLPTTLSEETSEGYEVGVEWLVKPGTFVEVVWFDTDIENELFWIGGFPAGGYMQAEGKSESKGIEFVTSVALFDNLTLGGNYTYNKTALRSDTTVSGAQAGDPRPRRPKHAYNLSARYEFWQDRMTFAAYYRNIQNAVDYPWGGDGPEALEDYDVLDLTGSWRITPQVETYVRWENALDEEYQVNKGYNTAGSAAYVGVRLRF